MKRILKKSGIVLLGVLAGLMLAEGTLRLLDIPRFYKAHLQPTRPQFSMVGSLNDTIFYTNTPSAVIEFVYDGNPRGYFTAGNAVRHTTNSLGFRGREFSATKDTNAFRIVFLGDSFTFGEGVKDEDVYPEQLASKLRKRVPRLRFEAYNFGVGGYNTEQSLFLLKHLALQFKPDAVVLGYVLNDAEPELFTVDAASRSVQRRPRESMIYEGLSDLVPPANAVFRLRLARLLWQVLSRQYATSRTVAYYNQLYRDDNPGWIATKRSLREFAEVCAKHRIDCYVVMFPLLFQLNDKYPFTSLSHAVQREIRSLDAVVPTIVDLFPPLKGRKEADLWVHPTDQHPNEVVHRLAADHLFEAILHRHAEWQ
jgi:hypothetical protein